MTIPVSLHDGYRRFRRDSFAAHAGRYRALAAGQNPAVMVVACADSRVDPATIFAAGPGELFVVRNVAAVVPPCEDTGRFHGTSAALEFAVAGLGVSHIVVLGHGLCGGVAAALQAADKRPVGRFIGPWVALLEDLCVDLRARMGGASDDALHRAAEHQTVRRSLDNLMSFPFVADRVRDGSLALHGAWFSIAEGALLWLDGDTGAFECVAD